MVSSQRNYELIKYHFVQGGIQDGTKSCVMFFGINFPHRRFRQAKKDEYIYTFVAFALIATGSDTTLVPLASVRSFRVTRCERST